MLRGATEIVRERARARKNSADRGKRKTGGWMAGRVGKGRRIRFSQRGISVSQSLTWRHGSSGCFRPAGCRRAPPPEVEAAAAGEEEVVVAAGEGSEVP